MARFLYVEDYDDLRAKIVNNLRKTFPMDTFITAIDYRSAIAAIDRDGPFDGIVSDWHYPGEPKGLKLNPTGGGQDLLRYVQDNKIKTPVAIVTLFLDIDLNDAIIKQGLKMPMGGFSTKNIESFHAIINSFKTGEWPQTAAPHGSLAHADFYGDR